MRPLICFGLLSMAPLFVPTDDLIGRAQPTEPLTLAQAIVLALKTSPRLQAARHGAGVAEAVRSEVKSSGLPTVELSVNGRIQGPVSSVLPQGPGAPTASALPGGGVINPDRALEPQLKLFFPIYGGGSLPAASRGAQRGVRAALLRVEAESQNLVFEVTQAYLDALEAVRQSQLAGALRELSEERLRVTRVRREAGATIDLEVKQMEAELAQAAQTEIEAHARLGSVGATLNTLIGREASAPLVLADLPATQPTQPILIPTSGPPSPEKLRKLGLERPDLRALQEEVKQAQSQIEVARAARRPQIGFNSSYLLRIPETLLGNYAWAVGATIVQSLFDGGKARARIAGAQAEFERRGANVKEAERRMSEQVEQSRLALDAAEQKLVAEDRKVAARAEAVSVALTRLHAGAAIPADITEAETSLARTETDAVTARFEAARARVRLAFVAGLAYPDFVAALAVTGQQADMKDTKTGKSDGGSRGKGR